MSVNQVKFWFQCWAQMILSVIAFLLSFVIFILFYSRLVGVHAQQFDKYFELTSQDNIIQDIISQEKLITSSLFELKCRKLYGNEFGWFDFYYRQENVVATHKTVNISDNYKQVAITVTVRSYTHCFCAVQCLTTKLNIFFDFTIFLKRFALFSVFLLFHIFRTFTMALYCHHKELLNRQFNLSFFLYLVFFLFFFWLRFFASHKTVRCTCIRAITSSNSFLMMPKIIHCHFCNQVHQAEKCNIFIHSIFPTNH